jgi:hypothetical protein
MKTFTINKHLTAECEYYETRYSWGHKAWLYRDGAEIGYKKITYYNRTWEAYEFQSILECLAESKELTTKEQKLFVKKIDDNWVKEDKKEVDKMFGSIGMVMAMGDILAKDKKGANDWKTRMLKAGLENKGLIMPEDWNELDENTKQARLDGVIAMWRS